MTGVHINNHQIHSKLAKISKECHFGLELCERVLEGSKRKKIRMECSSHLTQKVLISFLKNLIIFQYTLDNIRNFEIRRFYRTTWYQWILSVIVNGERAIFLKYPNNDEKK